MEQNELDDLKELHETKAEVYETWAVINRAFEQVITALEKLQKRGVLKWDYMHSQSVITNDLWAKLNTGIMAEVNRRELDDRNHFSRMKTSLEKRRKP
jgi:hypothetical protein